MVILKHIGKLLMLLALVSIYSCNKYIKTSAGPMGKTKINIQKIKQPKNNLLEGEYKAVCYSGFRTGQHPDRGDGAVNPSYGEVLEDLNIISDTLGFNLIRVYDCGENTEMILKVIDENDIDIKVMLGIWLRA